MSLSGIKRSIVLFGANKEIIILGRRVEGEETRASSVDNKFNIMREIQLKKSHPQKLEFELEIISEKTKRFA